MALQYELAADVLTVEQCERLITLFGDRVVRSTVGLGAQRAVSVVRTSSSFKIEHGEMPEDVLEVLTPCVEGITGLPAENQERWEIVRYREGEHFGQHYDLVPTPGANGQRLFSAVVSLRAPEAGGRLWFRGHEWALAAGSLLVWRNLRADGALDRSARHASLPVTQGTKWSLVTWIRSAAC